MFGGNRRKQKFEQSARAMEYGPVGEEKKEGFVLFKLMLVAAVCVLAWQIGGKLSGDALSMLIGVVFGAAASIPAALLVLAVGRRQENGHSRRDDESRSKRQPEWRENPQPPVIVVTGGPNGYQPAQGMPQQGMVQGYGGHALPQPGGGSRRQFHVVGESDDWLDQDVRP